MEDHFKHLVGGFTLMYCYAHYVILPLYYGNRKCMLYLVILHIFHCILIMIDVSVHILNILPGLRDSTMLIGSSGHNKKSIHPCKHYKTGWLMLIKLQQPTQRLQQVDINSDRIVYRETRLLLSYKIYGMRLGVFVNVEGKIQQQIY